MIRFYVYAYLNLTKSGIFSINTSMGDISFNNEPVYIGKGNNKRMESHVDETHNIKLENLIKSGKYEFTKLYEGLSSHQAYRIESEIIYKIGREDLNKGPLYNKSAGIHLNEADSTMNITPLNLELNNLIHILNVMNNSKSIKKAADKLKISERTLYRYNKDYNLKLVNNSWIQVL